MANGIVFTNSTGLGPSGNSPYDESIGDDSAVVQWITPDAGLITTSGTDVLTIDDRSSTETAFIIPSNRYPRLEDNVIYNWGGLDFYLATSRKWIASSNFPTSSDFSIIAIIKASEGGDARYILDTGVLPAVAGTFRASLRIESNEAIALDVSDGPRSPSFVRARAISTIPTVGETEEVFVVLATWDNTAKTAKISIDKGENYFTATNGSITNITSSAMRWGANAEDLQGLLAIMAGAILYNVDLSKTANAGRLETAKNWLNDRFGL